MNVFLVTPIGEKCNLACDYCYHNKLRKKVPRKIIPCMNDQVLEKLVGDAIRVASEPKKIKFIWHGGEPLLTGIGFYHKVVNYQNQFKTNGQEIINCIQTNATLIDQKWIDFFKENNFKVGISLDGPEHIHNIHRRYPSGRGSFFTTLKGMDLCKTNELEIGILATFTSSQVNCLTEIYQFMVDRKITQFDMTPCVIIDKSNAKFTPDPIEAGKALIQLNCEWFSFCKGGCAYHRFVFGKYPFCETRKMLFEHIVERVREVMNDIES